MTERAPDPFRPHEVPEAKRSTPAMSVGVLLGVALLVVLAVVVVWAIVR